MLCADNILTPPVFCSYAVHTVFNWKYCWLDGKLNWIETNQQIYSSHDLLQIWVLTANAAMCNHWKYRRGHRINLMKVLFKIRTYSSRSHRFLVDVVEAWRKTRICVLPRVLAYESVRARVCVQESVLVITHQRLIEWHKCRDNTYTVNGPPSVCQFVFIITLF